MTDIRERVLAALAAYDEAAEVYAAHADDDHASVKDYENWEDTQLDVLDTFITFARSIVTPEEGIRVLTLNAAPLPEGRMLGLRAGWINGENEHLVFDLDSTAGFGGVAMSMHVEFKDGGSVTETADIRDMATAWANALLAEHTAAVTS